MNPKRGFTLLELMLVLALMALLSGVISLSLASVSRQTTVRDAVSAITYMDRSMRDECIDFNRSGEIRFDLELGRITRVAHREGKPIEVESYQLPNTLRIEKFWLQGQADPLNHNSPIVIPCDSHGRTPTYALSIRPPRNPRNIDTGTEATVLGQLPGAGVVPGVVAGLTGQVQECQDETQVNDLFESLAWRDAD